MAEDVAMTKVHARFKESGMTLDELGQKMGYPAGTARQSVWQFQRTSDPRISVLRRFAKAMGIGVAELIEGSGDERVSRAKGSADKKAPSSRKKSRADIKA